MNNQRSNFRYIGGNFPAELDTVLQPNVWNFKVLLGGSKTQVTGQVRLQVRSGQLEEYFSAKEIDYIFGVFGFINRVDNVNWSPYRDFGGRTSYLPLGLYHASVK